MECVKVEIEGCPIYIERCSLIEIIDDVGGDDGFARMLAMAMPVTSRPATKDAKEIIYKFLEANLAAA